MSGDFRLCYSSCRLSYFRPDTKYTLVPDYSVLKEGDYCSVCINEYGLMISATMSLVNVPEEFLKMDPLTEEGSGIREANVCEPVICQSRDCREAIRGLAGLLEAYGAAESNAVLLSDKEEDWIFEIYGGTSWAAMRLPDDRAAVIGTLIKLEWVNPDDPGDDWYVSPNLKSLLDGMPIPVIRKDGCYNIAETLTPGKRETLYTMRIWRLQQRLCPSSVGPFDENFHYPLLLEPEEKVTVLEVMKLLGDRFEGTAYDMELLDWADRRTRFPAGDSNQSSAHIVQTFSAFERL